MTEKFVRGFVIVALVVMVMLSYAQKHHECLNGHLIKAFEQGHLKAFEPCGSVSPEM
jgi:hypothetical protein